MRRQQCNEYLTSIKESLEILITLPLLLLAFIGIQFYIALQVFKTKDNEPLVLNKTQRFYLHQRMLKHFGWIHTRKD